MPKVIRYIQGDISRIKGELESLPEKENDKKTISKEEALNLVIPAIESLQNKGYTISEIVAELNTRGLFYTERVINKALRSLPSSSVIIDVKRAKRKMEVKKEHETTKKTIEKKTHNFVKPDTENL